MLRDHVFSNKYLQFEEKGMDWASNDLKILKKVIEIIHFCRKSPFEGLGKPEPLKHQLRGYWSRRINDEHRLIYKVDDEKITIISCRDHY